MTGTTNGHSNGHSEAAQAKELGREQKELECALNDDELRLRGAEMATAELDIDKLKLKRSGLNGEIADLRAKCAKLAEAIDSKVEIRMVACVWIEELQQNAKRLVRQDTGETIDTRSLEVAELQTTLGGVFGDGGIGALEAENDNGDEFEPETATVIDDATGEVLTGEQAQRLEAAHAVHRASVAPRVRSTAGATKKPKNKAKQSSKKATKPSKHTRHVHA